MFASEKKNSMYIAWACFRDVNLRVSVEGLTCLSCDSITQPRHCHYVARCNSNEVIKEPLHEKTNNVVFEQVRHKPSCTST